MLRRIWERLGLVERRPAEIYRFDQHAVGAHVEGDGRVSSAPSPDTPASRPLAGFGSPSRPIVEPVPVDAVPVAQPWPQTPSAAAEAPEPTSRGGGSPDRGGRDAAVLPFAPAAARAAARRDETPEWVWAAAAVVTVAGAALVAGLYRHRRMRTQ